MIIGAGWAFSGWTTETSFDASVWAFALFFVQVLSFHTGIGLCVVAALAGLRRLRLAAVVSLLIAAPLLAPVAWSWRPRSAVASPGPPITILSANLLFPELRCDRFLELVRSESPDIIFIQEYTPEKREKIRPALEDDYPHYVEAPRIHAFGQALFSRFPILGEPQFAPHLDGANSMEADDPCACPTRRSARCYR